MAGRTGAQEAVTVGHLMAQAQAALAETLKLSSSEARIEAQMLLMHALGGVARAWLIAHEYDPVAPGQQDKFKALRNRRLAGEPIAYILGEREFFGLMFKITPGTLIPRPETELLVELALQRCGRVAAPPPGTHRPPPDNSAWALAHSGLRTFSACGGIPEKLPPPQPSDGTTDEATSHPTKQPKDGCQVVGYSHSTRLSNYASQVHPQGVRRGCKGLKPQQHTQAGYPVGRGETCRVLDLGTGSGAIALTIAHARPAAEVLACDASSAALAVARENAQRLGIANAAFVQSNWFEALDAQRFDLIVSNPPYIAADDPHLQQGDVRFEPPSALASGSDGLEDIRHIAAHAQAHLQPGGWLLLEHGYDQAARVRELLQQNGFSEIFSACDLAGIERVSGGRIFS